MPRPSTHRALNHDPKQRADRCVLGLPGCCRGIQLSIVGFGFHLRMRSHSGVIGLVRLWAGRKLFLGWNSSGSRPLTFGTCAQKTCRNPSIACIQSTSQCSDTSRATRPDVTNTPVLSERWPKRFDVTHLPMDMRNLGDMYSHLRDWCGYY